MAGSKGELNSIMSYMPGSVPSAGDPARKTKNCQKKKNHNNYKGNKCRLGWGGEIFFLVWSKAASP